MDNQGNLLLEITNVEGLGNARALFASIVGPYRLAMGSKRSVRLNAEHGVELYKNIGAGQGYVLVGVALPANAPLQPLDIIAGDTDELGFNTGTPQIITRQMGGGGQSVAGFMQLLLPGDQLFAQIVDTAFIAGPATEQQVVVAVVTL